MFRGVQSVLGATAVIGWLAACGTVDPNATAVDTPSGDAVDVSEQLLSLDPEVARRIFVNGSEVNYGLLRSTVATSYRHKHVGLLPRQRVGAFRLLLTDLKQHKQNSQDRRHWLNGVLCQVFGVGACEYEVQKIFVGVVAMDIRGADGLYVRVADFAAQPRVVDLMNFANGGFSDLGALNLPPATYTGVRLTLRTANHIQVVEGGVTRLKPLSMQSASLAVIDLAHQFVVNDFQLTMLKLDFDVQKSISRNFWGQYFLRPHVSVVDAIATDAIEQIITHASGGTIAIHDEISLQIPAHAVASDVVVRIKPTYRLLPHATSGMYLIGQEYEIQPADLQLAVAARLQVMPQPIYAAVDMIDASTLAIYQRAEVNRVEPIETAGSSDAGLVADVTRFGSYVLGAAVGAAQTSSAACARLSAMVTPPPAAKGLDLKYFSAACERHNSCYAHGYQTYGKMAAQCDDELRVDAMQACERLCMSHPDGGVTCSEIESGSASPDLQTALQLYGQCQQLAGALHTAAVSSSAQAYPGDATSTCSDYDQAGVSCMPATCSLSVDPPTVAAYTPTDFTFSLKVQGSVSRVTFDGSTAYVHEGLATPVDLQITIADAGRELSESRTFSAVVTGPGGNAAAPVICSVTVAVSEAPACILTIDPDTIQAGGSGAALALHVAPGYEVAQTDLRQEGVFRDAGLSAADENGWRHFYSTANPAASRSYNARVWDGAGNMRTCSEFLTVAP